MKLQLSYRHTKKRNLHGNGDRMAVADEQCACIGFERKLHIPVIITIVVIFHEIMKPYKIKKRKVFVKLSVLPEVLYQYGQLHKLAQLRAGQQLQR